MWGNILTHIVMHHTSPLANMFNPLPVNIFITLQAVFVNPHAVNITLLHSSHDSLLVGKHEQHFAVAIYSNCNVNMVTFFHVNILTLIYRCNSNSMSFVGVC
jgi:hypothetical protein